jgi:2-polyprenyl-3-methyl-5-hydroxy-6-metoxy-1,4-benzoquinol methylase
MVASSDQSRGQTVWDRIYAEGGFGRETEPQFVTLCTDLPSGRALDVGAGEGNHTLWLAARGWRVDAMDISSESL